MISLKQKREAQNISLCIFADAAMSLRFNTTQC